MQRPMEQKSVAFFDPKQEAEVKRKRSMADALMKQSTQRSGNETAGGMTVAKSGWETALPGLQGIYGEYLGGKADAQGAELTERKQKGVAEALKNWGNDPSGTAATLMQDPDYQNLGVKMLEMDMKNNAPFGVQSGGFEGDMARSLYVLSDPNSDTTAKARAQAVLDAAQRMTGSWDPVSGSYVYNNKNRFGGMQQQGMQQSMPQQPMGMPQQAPQPQGSAMPMQQPMMQAPEGGLLPPLSGMGQPDMSVFQGTQPAPAFQPTGNRKMDAALQQQAMEIPLAAQKEAAIGQARANTELANAANIERQKAMGAPLPANIIQQQQETMEKVQTAEGTQRNMDKFIQQIDNGTLDLGMMSNLQNMALNNMAMSTEQSRNLSSFQSALEKMRNDSLRLNTGVQTDGDAQRAWNELVNNINDPQVVRQRLAEIKEINRIGAQLQQQNLNLTRAEYGRGGLQVPSINAPQSNPVGSTMLAPQMQQGGATDPAAKLRAAGFPEERIQQFLQSGGM